MITRLPQKYRELQINTSSPLQRVLIAYDTALIACSQRDLKRVTDALNVLRNALDLDQGEPAIGLFRLYQYCAELARQGQFDDAAHILRELVDTWVQVLVREMEANTTKVRAAEIGLSVLS